MLEEIDEFIAHKKGHRALFTRELAMRGRSRCRSYHLCGIGGTILGLVTGMIGARAIAATTVAIESVVTAHIRDQLKALAHTDGAAVAAISSIVEEEQAHLDYSLQAMGSAGWLTNALLGIVSFATEAVIWLGMRL